MCVCKYIILFKIQQTILKLVCSITATYNNIPIRICGKQRYPAIPFIIRGIRNKYNLNFLCVNVELVPF